MKLGFPVTTSLVWANAAWPSGSRDADIRGPQRMTLTDFYDSSSGTTRATAVCKRPQAKHALNAESAACGQVLALCKGHCRPKMEERLSLALPVSLPLSLCLRGLLALGAMREGRSSPTWHEGRMIPEQPILHELKPAHTFKQMVNTKQTGELCSRDVLGDAHSSNHLRREQKNLFCIPRSGKPKMSLK
ncbi:hypothetical protein EYF80_001518 [Liparis tanakae]|uniref:Uncharacterized protein n=1 Tax=Liparis tanakae TaxID=230148 RepID=A0A4Z2JG97_9TELE|nr:hypothetical protein EYF80_001518 [Liparis tanakae]